MICIPMSPLLIQKLEPWAQLYELSRDELKQRKYQNQYSVHSSYITSADQIRQTQLTVEVNFDFGMGGLGCVVVGRLAFEPFAKMVPCQFGNEQGVLSFVAFGIDFETGVYHLAFGPVIVATAQVPRQGRKRIT